VETYDARTGRKRRKRRRGEKGDPQKEEVFLTQSKLWSGDKKANVAFCHEALLSNVSPLPDVAN